ncbi:MAG TPA: hypothetical protein VGM19_14880 [Armatimonadota bacterium]|jgi:hypothetical protein
MPTATALPAAEVAIVQDLAREYAEIIADPRQQERTDLWKALNRMEPVRPMVRCSNSAWDQTLDDSVFQCRDPFCRQQEDFFRYHLYMWRNIQDDFVFDDAVYVPVVVHNTGWGLEADRVRPDHVFGAAHFEPVIRQESDIEKLHLPEVTVDWEQTQRDLERTTELYDGLLPVKTRGVAGFWFAIFDDYITWRGLGDAFVDMVDRPQWLHRVLELMTQGMIAQVEALEAAGALALNNGANGTQAVGPGGLAFTDELPQADFDGVHVRPRDMWAHATTQIFADVSPAMHEEFALQYEGRFLSRFGLTSYGCCEPLHRKVDLVFKYIPELRRLSMSPWVDVAQGAEALGRRAIFSYKPNPAVFAGDRWDPESVRRNLREVLEITRGCVVEVIMKDLHSCNYQPQRLTEWTRIAMELAEEFAY